jgi:hypothetical protein
MDSQLMILRHYIHTIRNAGIFKGSCERFVEKLLYASGYPEDQTFGNGTIKGWLREKNSDNGYRDPDITVYFPDSKIDEDGFIRFIKSRDKGDWKRIQKEFKEFNEQHPEDKDFCVNINTDSPYVLYESLLNQLLRILMLPEKEYDADSMVKTFKQICLRHDLIFETKVVVTPVGDRNDPIFNEIFKDILVKNEETFRDTINTSLDSEDELLEDMRVCANDLRCDLLEPFKNSQFENHKYQYIDEFCQSIDKYTVAVKFIKSENFAGYQSIQDAPIEILEKISKLYHDILKSVSIKSDDVQINLDN